MVVQSRAALPSRFGHAVRYYVAAGLVLPVGGRVGVVMSRGDVSDSVHGGCTSARRARPPGLGRPHRARHARRAVADGAARPDRGRPTSAPAQGLPRARSSAWCWSPRGRRRGGGPRRARAARRPGTRSRCTSWSSRPAPRRRAPMPDGASQPLAWFAACTSRSVRSSSAHRGGSRPGPPGRAGGPFAVGLRRAGAGRRAVVPVPVVLGGGPQWRAGPRPSSTAGRSCASCSSTGGSWCSSHRCPAPCGSSPRSSCSGRSSRSSSLPDRAVVVSPPGRAGAACGAGRRPVAERSAVVAAGCSRWPSRWGSRSTRPQRASGRRSRRRRRRDGRTTTVAVPALACGSARRRCRCRRATGSSSRWSTRTTTSTTRRRERRRSGVCRPASGDGRRRCRRPRPRRLVPGGRASPDGDDVAVEVRARRRAGRPARTSMPHPTGTDEAAAPRPHGRARTPASCPTTRTRPPASSPPGTTPTA